jgi:hypothetical protein
MKALAQSGTGGVNVAAAVDCANEMVVCGSESFASASQPVGAARAIVLSKMRFAQSAKQDIFRVAITPPCDAWLFWEQDYDARGQ